MRTIAGGKILSLVGPWSDPVAGGEMYLATGHGATAMVLNEAEGKIHHFTFRQGGVISYHPGLFVSFFENHIISETEQILHFAAAAL